MSTLSLTHISREQKTFAVAMALLGAVAAAQLLSALYFFTRRPPEAPAAAEPRRRRRIFSCLRRKLTATSAVPAKVPARGQASRTAVAPARPSPESVPETLLRVAKGFRERGDTTNAIAKLQQAAALDPGNADILAELALTYESMQLFDRSNEVWRRLHSLGTQAGPLSSWPS
jgi:tetratricopeptide (TPR) repeat protein